MGSERRELEEKLLWLEKGMLFQYQEFKNQQKGRIVYCYDCPEYESLRNEYGIEKIAGKGDNYSKAKRLLHHLAPRMAHDSMYDNHVECNALALLTYCYEKPEHGINCLNKSKILVECCLALGIPARRVFLLPASPYDGDSHVVTEIFDDTRGKWVMMDPTTDGFYVDDKGEPLSLLEMRSRFANDQFLTYQKSNARGTDYRKTAERSIMENQYICKNLFSFQIEKYQEYGSRKDNEMYYFVPVGYSVRENRIANAKFRIKLYGKDYPEYREMFEKAIVWAEGEPEPVGTDITVMEEVGNGKEG